MSAEAGATVLVGLTPATVAEVRECEGGALVSVVMPSGRRMVLQVADVYQPVLAGVR